eukprot:CAMPEP_0183417506 /NCGR_PEP_ID=MMETSP0370-20130417/24472_1 /TAXON_ID=268820 /ORGANISM="Peridinium aciculiferum, Strain PAER-2" /LENGTH=65 /DNA_ID=CAMNT_0025601103 /DNA_START=68 /DNA_END=262 /DNA_ORIENTATION=+
MAWSWDYYCVRAASRYSPSQLNGNHHHQRRHHFFEWENSKDLYKFTGMTPAQIPSELEGSNYLTK